MHRTTGMPLYNAIVWMDCRGDEVINHFTDLHDKEWYHQKTGLPLSSYFTGPKLYWAITYLPEVKKAMEDGKMLVGTIDSWLIWNLTGGVNGGIHTTDITNASRTMMMNIERRAGKDEPVIKKALVELDGLPYQRFLEQSQEWKLNDCYSFPGPIQFTGPAANIVNQTLLYDIEARKARLGH